MTYSQYNPHKKSDKIWRVTDSEGKTITPVLEGMDSGVIALCHLPYRGAIVRQCNIRSR